MTSLQSDAAGWLPADTLGARLALVRQRMKWNRRQAAVACGLDEDSWRNWEAGRRPQKLVAIVQTISEVTGCDRDWLMWGGPLADSDGNLRTPGRFAAVA